jgi:hypothetical protein
VQIACIMVVFRSLVIAASLLLSIPCCKSSSLTTRTPTDAAADSAPDSAWLATPSSDAEIDARIVDLGIELTGDLGPDVPQTLDAPALDAGPVDGRADASGESGSGECPGADGPDSPIDDAATDLAFDVPSSIDAACAPDRACIQTDGAMDICSADRCQACEDDDSCAAIYGPGHFCHIGACQAVGCLDSTVCPPGILCEHNVACRKCASDQECHDDIVYGSHTLCGADGRCVPAP